MKKEVVDLYKQMDFGHRVGFGERPALILIDFICGLTDPDIGPQGFEQNEAIFHSKRLLDVAREKGVPVIFTTVAYTEGYSDGGVFIKKVPALKALLAGSKSTQIDERVKPRPNEPVIVKKFSSSFFGTNLASLLTGLRVDTTILVGNSTSGCVRSTCTDSMQSGFRTIIPRECVADRALEVHEANLFDMDSKFADVVSVEEALAYLQGLPPFQV
jgi:nicotinamidase-related amidase